MEMFVIEGGTPLRGRLDIRGAKNAALPILASTVLSEGECRLQGVPRLQDVEVMLELLGTLGVEACREPDGDIVTRVVDPAQVMAPYEIVRKMRASICLLGPLLARRGAGIVSMPGGCVIGTRPIDLHLKGLRALGATIGVEGGYVHASHDGLRGAEMYLGGPMGSTVLGTANVLMAAVLARGTTVIDCAAQEPEVVDLIHFLQERGARIEGAGTSRLVIEGVETLTGGTHRIIPDRIEAATFLAAVALSRGDAVLDNVEPGHMTAVLQTLEEMGVEHTTQATKPGADGVVPGGTGTSVRVQVPGDLRAVDITTMPYPAFPTDAQAQLMALMTTARGTGQITEKIYPDRFMHVAELVRLGADIRREGNVAMVRGVDQLSGAPVMASDLRASAALVLAGLVARGTTRVRRIYHLDRGYERMEERLTGLGASVHRVQDREPEE